MKVENLKIFMTVARTENMHKTAEIYFTSYQNISFIIKNMERELGFTLFTRDNKGMRLTQEGEELLQIAERFIHEYDEFLIRQAAKDTLPLFHFYTTAVMERYVRTMQNMIYSDYYYCSLKKSTVSEMLDMLANNQPGIYLLPGFNGNSQKVMTRENSIVLSKDKNIIVCHCNHPILQDEVVISDNIKQYPLVISGGNVIHSASQTVLYIDDVELCKRYMREKAFLYSTTQFIFDTDFTEPGEWAVIAENEKRAIEYDLIFNLQEPQLSIARHFFLEPLQALFQNTDE